MDSSPRIISLGTNVSQLTAGESVRFVAVVTDPAGLENLAGGQLTSEDGLVKYAAFTADRQGSFSLDLSWGQLNQAKSIDFALDDNRSLVAEFYNAQGLKTAQKLQLRLHCKGKGACDGQCLDEGAACGQNLDRLCVKGVCAEGCYADGVFYPPNGTRPGQICATCQPDMNRSRLLPILDGTNCGGGLRCFFGGCVVGFKSVYGYGNPKYMTQVWGSGPADVWLVGSSILRSTDGGVTWASKLDVGQSYTSVWGSSASDIYVLVNTGSALHTTNGGTSFTSQSTGSTVTLNRIWGSGASDVYAVGYNGTIVHTINGGTNWTKPMSGVGSTLNAIWGSGAGNVIVVGDAGVILRSTDSGASWAKPASGTTKNLYDIWGSGSDVWIVGSGVMLRSSDGGATWTGSTMPVTFYSIWGSSVNDIYVGVSGESLRRSTDGGATWSGTSVPGGGYAWGSSATDVYAIGQQQVWHRY